MLFFFKGPLSQQYQKQIPYKSYTKVSVYQKTTFLRLAKMSFGKQKQVYTWFFQSLIFHTFKHIFVRCWKTCWHSNHGPDKKSNNQLPSRERENSPTWDGKFGNSSSQLLLEEDVSFQEGIFSLKNQSSPPLTVVVFPWLTPNLVGKHLWDWDGHFFQQRPRHGKQGEFCCVSLKILDKGAADDTVTCNKQ